MRFFFLFYVFSLFANTTVTENDPSSLVEGVSVITGDFYVFEEDYAVQGAEPIPIWRAFLSATGNSQAYRHLVCDYLFDFDKLWIPEPNGTVLVYARDLQNRVAPLVIGKHFYGKKQKPLRYNVDLKKIPGVSNTASGKICAQTNLKNQYILFDPAKDKHGKSFTLYAADGTERRYVNVVGQKKIKTPYGEKYAQYFYHLESEMLPNGHVVHYKWDDKNRLEGIRTSGSDGRKTFASLAVPILDLGNLPSDVVFSGSDGRSLSHYRVLTSKGAWLLGCIHSPDYPNQTLEWEPSHQSERFRVHAFSFPNRRKICIEYDDEQRIKTLSAPVGKDDCLIATHTFHYQPQEKTTMVVDVYGNQTNYFWNDDFRLIRMDRVGHSSDLFIWEGTQLRCKAFLNEKGEPVFARTYSYDEFGNPAEEIFYGNLSGNGRSLQLNQEKLPAENRVEKCIRKTIYTTDGRNLPRREEHPNGLVVEYDYYPSVHLVWAKFLLGEGKIQLRNFYFYDSDWILVKEVQDDGSSRAPNELANVTVRTIRKIHPVRDGPYVGMPEVIEEKCWDGKQERLLKKTVLHYTTGGRVAQKEIYDAEGNFRYALQFHYDEKGRLIRETNPLGQEAIYRYDEVGNKCYEKDFSGRLETRFSYDFSNRLIEKEEKGFDGLKRIFKYSYDEKHRLISEKDPYGQITFYEYDPFGHLTKTTLPPLPNGEGQLISPVATSSYDSAGNEILRVDARGFATCSSYNAYGKPLCIEHPDGTCEGFTYYFDGSLKTQTDPTGIQTHYWYDFLGRVKGKEIPSLALETFEYKGNVLLSKTDFEKNKTIYSYDGAGRKIAEEYGREKILYFYDSLGRLFKTQEGDLVTITDYDLLDRVIGERKESLSGEVFRKVVYDYDEAGNQTLAVRFVEGKEAKEEFVYDSFNRLIKKIDPLGHVETTAYSDNYLNPHRQRVLQIIHTDPLGLETITTYDAQGRVAQVEKRKGKPLALAEKTYHPNGLLAIQVDTIYSPDGSQRKAKTTWEYDGRDRLETLCEAGEKTTRYTYTKRGELSQTIKPDGVVLTCEYDEFGYLRSLSSSDGTVNHTTIYNKIGHLIEFDGILRELDCKGRIKKELFPQGFSLENTYDARGRRKTCSIPRTSCLIQYHYNPTDLIKITRKQHGTALYKHVYGAYDLSGNLLREDLIGNLGATSFTYDPLSRKTSFSSPNFSQKILEYDAIGNLRKMVLQGEEISYTYDPLYQLTSETGPFTHTYAFDSLHNLLKKDEDLYQTNALHQVPSHLRYDKSGNPIQFNETVYTYDALDRLIRIDAPTFIQTFTYDALYRCLSQTTTCENTPETRYFLYDGQNEIGSCNQNGWLTELRVLGNTPHAEIGAAISMELPGQIFAPIHDLQGNLAALLPLSPEEPPIFYRYSAFGEESNSAISPWRYSSKRTDSLSGLVHFGRRYYLPPLGRWLTPDPEGFHDGMNLYAFLHNNPLTHFDEYGLLDYGQWSKEPPFWTRERKAAVFHEVSSYGLQASRFASDAFFAMGRPEFNLSDVHKGVTFYSVLDQWNRSQDLRFKRAEDWMYRAFSADRADPTYLQMRKWTSYGLDYGPLFVGGLGLAKASYSGGRQLFKRFAFSAAKKFGRSNQIIRAEKIREVSGIRGFTEHAVNRAIDRKVSPSAILDALRNPIVKHETKVDHLGRLSQRLIGKKVEVVINPTTKKIISVNPTSSRKYKRLTKELFKDEAN